MILGLSLMSCSLVAMDKSYLTLEQRLMMGRMLEGMEPNASRELQLWQQNNMLELKIWQRNNMRESEIEHRRNMQLLLLRDEIRRRT